VSCPAFPSQAALLDPFSCDDDFSSPRVPRPGQLATARRGFKVSVLASDDPTGHITGRRRPLAEFRHCRDWVIVMGEPFDFKSGVLYVQVMTADGSLGYAVASILVSQREMETRT
jgi:hypothetical protein